jgi:thiol-disulfide isomerase/thioredoxin
LKNSTLMLMVGLACAASGFASYRYTHRDSATTRTIATAAAPKADSAALSAGAEEQSAPATRVVPETVPDLKLPGIDGKLRALKEFGGGPRIINFWATWCAPCRREIPLLNELQARHQSEHLKVLGIAVDLRDAVAEFTKTTHFDYPLLVGEKEGAAAASQFGMDVVLPFSIFADAQDRVIAVKVGELHPDEADAILDTMRQLAGGQIGLADARQRINERLKQLAVERSQKSAKSA